MRTLKILLHGNDRSESGPREVIDRALHARAVDDACGADRAVKERVRACSVGLEAVGEGGVAASGAGSADGGGEGFAGADED